jgi:hypothetical protein
MADGRAPSRRIASATSFTPANACAANWSGALPKRRV